MPSGPIQPRLPGFLDLLQLKNQGRQPPLLSDEVQLQFDVSQWFGLDRMEVVQSNYARNAGFNTNNVQMFQVPGNETWMIVWASCHFVFTNPTTTALAWSRFVPTAEFPGNSSAIVDLADFQPFDSTIFQTFPGTMSFVQGPGKIWPRPIFLPSKGWLGFSFVGDHTDAVNNALVYATFGVIKLLV